MPCFSPRSSSRPIALGVLSMALLTILGGTLLAQESSFRFRRSQLLTGRQMRRAFEEVNAGPRESTVRFLEGDEQSGLGTIVGEDGWILTKASQVQDADAVELPDGRTIPFQQIGYLTNLDLALLKADVTGLKPVTWKQEDPQIGSWFVTVGADDMPAGIGVMSVARRNIPRSDVHGVMGIQLERHTEARIRQVFPNSGASDAGLLAGDVILEVNRKMIDTSELLMLTLKDYRPGDTVEIRVRREEEELSCSVTLTHPFGALLSRWAFQNQMGGELSFRRDDFEAVFQHDTVLAPEDCGGPVVMLDGEAVGINIARAGRTESFVLPADLIVAVIDDLKSGKHPFPGDSNAPQTVEHSTDDETTPVNAQ